MMNWPFRSLRNQQRQTAAHRRTAERRARKPRFEPLEGRIMLTAVHWVGGATGLWDHAANWSNNLVPTSADDVTINSPASATITIQSGDVESVNSLTTTAGDVLAMTGGSLAIAASSMVSGNLNLSGGVQVLSGAVVNNLGTLVDNGSNTLYFENS
jgi:hypothetical protein